MTLVVLLHKQSKHGVIVRYHFRVAVPVKEQETALTVHDNSLCLLQLASTRFNAMQTFALMGICRTPLSVLGFSMWM